MKSKRGHKDKRHALQTRASITKQKLGITITVVILLLILLFFSRFGIMRYYINRKVHRFNQNTHVELKFNNISFKGINEVCFNKLILISKTKTDSLLYIDSTAFSINLFSILKGELKINSIKAGDLRLHLIDIKDYNNFSFLFNKERSPNEAEQKHNYAKQINKLFEAFFYKTPKRIDVKNIYCLIQKDNKKLRILAENLVLENNNLETIFDIIEEGGARLKSRYIGTGSAPAERGSKLALKGNINTDNKMLSLLLYSVSDKKFNLTNFKFPFTDIDFNTLGFDSLKLAINNNGSNNDIVNLKGVLAISKFHFDNPRIAQNEVVVNKAGIDFNLNVGTDFIEMDSSTVISINSLNFSPYIKYINGGTRYKRAPDKITLLLNKDKFDAQDLFGSLPQGMFDNLTGLKTKGELEYHLKFIVDLSLPDSLKFSSSLKKKNFSILSLGNSNLTKLNGSFLYTAYDKDKPVRTLTIGPENPDFTALKNVSPYLIYSVLTSEDGGFFINRGFNEDAFRESIIKNIKEKRFARGGSTISMQLVKNVFLNRNKNISRKLEEALIVWLIENNNLSSKERMLEVYLNIIEWGPRIYGIGEASRFYFNKKAANLSLAESIYLASIIPHPKWYKYSFDSNGELREGLKGFYKLVSSKMLRKEYITQSDFDNLKPEVKLKGASLKMLMKDTLGKKVNIDSLFIRTEEE